ncbi:guanine nucleotide exchange factor DBS-like isoform X2 [Condylostylus longicornis]|uniref:guanine nucleotide exchange factor DBS-like isoform X2 n=1 Tax=Condylostylus longicornis TaxID=2530218 RepID=UPI00244E02A7|nr:guanine nucleotide exchange factor DBS-like isoform X2 [Condylostylus longicornis]
MENATNSIEMQIDNFLEHFKISSQSSSDWGDTPGSNFSNLIKSRSRSSCLDVADLSDNDLERVLTTNNESQNSQQQQYSFNQQPNFFNGSSILKSVLQSNVTNSSCVQNSNNQYPSSTDNSAKINYVNDALHIGDVADLLHFQHAILTGGKSRDGCPLIIFPDNNNFQYLEDIEYQKLLTYLTSVPAMQDADLGFQIVVDRRKDKWTAVKAVLLKISMFFPDIVHVVYVLRPSGFLQKAISEVSSKFFKEDFRFRLVICSTLEDLHEHLEKSQLTPDMGGTLIYSHHEWIQQRISLEQFSRLTQKVSADLDVFIQYIHETEFPNSVDATQKLIDDQCEQYNSLKEEIAAAAKHGEGLLINMKIHEDIKEFSERTGNVSALERLLVQLEETERRFDEFFATHQNRLKLCLDLRKFEQNFRELQICLDAHVKTVSEMTEIGDSVARVEILMNETKEFENICKDDIDRATEVIESGQQLIGIQGAYQKDVVQPKCDELYRMCDIINDRLAKRIETLSKNGELMERVEKANKWCQRGVELIASQHMEKCSLSADLAEQYLQEIQTFVSSSDEFQLSSPKEFKNVFVESTTQETKALVTQVLERLNDVSLMCDKRIVSLKKLALKPPRPVQTVTPEPAVPLQPPGLPPHFRRRSHPKTNLHDLRPRSTEGGIDSGVSMSSDSGCTDNDFGEQNKQDLESRRLKRGHVLHELLETERIYVTEMNSILKGYRDQMESEEMVHLVPPGLQGKEDILFGNLHELYTFHSETFLKDLENCISTTELVALCFVQRRDTFYRLYSFYCQNIPRSERLRETLVDTHLFLHECQKKLGHKLPLGAYLLKPVQRITKYQLLLKDLLRFSDSGTCTKELQKALDCMLIVLKCVNDSMHQIAITGYPHDLSQQGELLLQDSFQVWTENKKDLRLRLKPQQRHIFLYQKSMLFCKQAAKPTTTGHNKSTYQYKNDLKMSQIGLTESVRGDTKRFEVWLQGRQEVYTLQAPTIDIKNKWVTEIKRVLLNQLEELKGEKIKQYGLNPRTVRPSTNPWDTPITVLAPPLRSLSCDTSGSESNRNSNYSDDLQPGISSSSSEQQDPSCGWSSDYSNSEDELSNVDDNSTPGTKYTALADYCAIGHSEVSMREGDSVELLKVGCAGWWFVKVLGTNAEGWTPAAYLEPIHRKSSRCSSRVE